MKKTIVLLHLGCTGLLAGPPGRAAVLESPANQAVVSGIGSIAG